MFEDTQFHEEFMAGFKRYVECLGRISKAMEIVGNGGGPELLVQNMEEFAGYRDATESYLRDARSSLSMSTRLEIDGIVSDMKVMSKNHAKFILDGVDESKLTPRDIFCLAFKDKTKNSETTKVTEHLMHSMLTACKMDGKSDDDAIKIVMATKFGLVFAPMSRVIEFIASHPDALDMTQKNIELKYSVKFSDLMAGDEGPKLG